MFGRSLFLSVVFNNAISPLKISFQAGAVIHQDRAGECAEPHGSIALHPFEIANHRQLI